MKKYFVFIILLLISFNSAIGFGQEAVLPEIESLEDASIVSSRVEEEKSEFELKAEKVDFGVFDDSVEKVQVDSSLDFFIKKIEIKNNNLLSDEEVRNFVSGYEGREQNMRTLTDLADDITAHLRGQGFVTSLAYIPPQTLQRGIFYIEIVEGKFGEATFEGQRFVSEKRLRKRLTFDSSDTLNYDVLRETIVKLNTNPDRRVRAVLQKSEEPHKTDVTFKVKDRFPVHAGFSIDNQGSDTTGERRFGFNLSHTDFLRLDDQFLAGTVFGSHFGSLYLQHSIPVPWGDFKLKSGFNHSQVSPKRHLKRFGINGTSQSYFAGFDKRWVQKKSFTWDMDATFSFKESRTKVLSGTFRRERLRVFKLINNFQIRDPYGANQLRQTTVMGFDGLGAASFIDSTTSRKDAGPKFLAFKLDYNRAQKFIGKSRLHFKAKVQVAANKIPSSESFFLGGADSIRGYPEGDYLADTGFLLSLEHIMPATFLPDWLKLPYSDRPLSEDVELVTFIDQGFGYTRGHVITQKENRHLMGIGAGLRIRLYEKLYGRLEFAHALTEVPLTDDGRFQVHFRLQGQI